MDQNAFRSLLASRPAASSSHSSSSKTVLGKAAPKRSAWGLKASAKTEKLLAEKSKADNEAGESKPDFVPRQQQRRAPPVPVKENGERYLDRAAMRRQGKDDEYTEVVRTLEDFERRQKEAGADERQIEETRKHLGGDAEHSVLVKGLDFGLLAARKAELEREKEDLADEELDALLGERKVDKMAKVEEKKVVSEEKLGKGFKAIGKKAEQTPGGEVKKKKKKKKVKAEWRSAAVKEETTTREGQTKQDGASAAAAPAVALPKAAPLEDKTDAPAPAAPGPESEDEGDIFADVGGYDLDAGQEDSESEDDAKVDVAEGSTRPDRLARSRTPRSRSHSEEGRYRSRSRSRGDERRRYRSVSYERDAGDDRRRFDSRHDRRYRERSQSRERGGGYDTNDRYDRHDRYDLHDRYERYDRRDGPSRFDRRDRHDRYDGRYDDRYDSRGPPRSPCRPAERFESRGRDEPPIRRRSPSYSRSPSPPRRRHSPSPSPTPPPAKRPRQRTRTPSPTMFQHHISSPEMSDSEDEGLLLPGGKLQPLASSALGDIKGFLAADADATKADEKRLRKAQWRARQGLAPQEGVDAGMLEKKLGDKQRANRDYQLVMNQVSKGQKGDEGAGGAANDVE